METEKKPWGDLPLNLTPTPFLGNYCNHNFGKAQKRDRIFNSGHGQKKIIVVRNLAGPFFEYTHTRTHTQTIQKLVSVVLTHLSSVGSFLILKLQIYAPTGP